MLYAIKHDVPNFYLSRSDDWKNTLDDDTVYMEREVVERLFKFARENSMLTRQLWMTIKIVRIEPVNTPMYQEVA